METHGFEGINPTVLAQWKDLGGDPRPGPDWVSTEELSVLWGVSRNIAYRRVERLVELGKAERSKGDGGRTSLVFYRLKELPS